MDYVGGKHNRVLSLYNKLLDGDEINVNSASEKFAVSTKTIKRDIEDIRSFLSEKCSDTGEQKEVVYDRSTNTYRMTGYDKLTNKEILALCKVILESRAFKKKEFTPIIDKMVECCAYNKDFSHIKGMIANEKYHYVEPIHGKMLVDLLWDLSLAVKEQKRIEIQYERLTEPKVVSRIVEPVGILFSDFYFYLIAFIKDKGTEFPTVYRVDRIKKYKIIDENFRIPYSNRFEEGEFRKRIQFMYGGELLKIEFKYYGESIEAILDRLPTAEISSVVNGIYYIRAEVFGRGIKPWILSQANKIEILEPIELRNEMKELIRSISNNYSNL